MVNTLSGAKVTYTGGADQAAGSMKPGGSSRLFRRFLEAFFGRPILCLLPLVVMSAIGVYSLRGTSSGYQAVGVISVSNTSLLSDLTEVGRDPGFSFETPAQLTSQTINELMGTNEFALDVLDGAAAAADFQGMSTPAMLNEVRSSVGAGPSGRALVSVAATTSDPDLSVRLARSTIDAFTQWVIDVDVSQSSAAKLFFDKLVEQYASEVDVARSALETYLVEHPLEPGQRRAAAEVLIVDRLEAELDVAETQYAAAVANQQSAQLATEQAQVDIEQRLRLVDVPDDVVEIVESRRDQAMTLAMYFVAGLLFSAGLVALRAFLDRSVQSTDDIVDITGRDALATVAEAHR